MKVWSECIAGEPKKQILSVIGDYNPKKYNDSKNMSLANELFIRDVYEESINDNYKNLLLQKFNAEVKIDSFKNPDKINLWVMNKTFKYKANIEFTQDGIKA